jgi:hypothetical protein
MTHPLNKNEIVFYTVFIGAVNNIANMIQPPPSTFYDCLYYTNNLLTFNNLVGTGWKGVWVNLPILNDESDNMLCKFFKARPHALTELEPYDFSVYIDSKRSIRSDYEILKTIRSLPLGIKICMCAHDFIGPPRAIFKEFEESMHQERYLKNKNEYISYINSKTEEFPNEPPNHLHAGFAIRRHNDPVTHAFNDTWYSEIQKCGIQCQISLYFVQQMFPDIIQVYEAKEVGFNI